LYFAGIPGNVADLPRDHVIETFIDQASCFLNSDPDYGNAKHCTLHLAERLQGKPVNVDLFDEPMERGIITNKQDEKYGAWLQLDFKSTSQNGNYEIKQYHQDFRCDLEKVLAKYPIKELADEQSKQQLIKSLERGNLQAATFEIAGKEERLFITPNVAFKTLSAYNQAGQRISLKDLFQSQEQSAKQEQKIVQTEKQTEKET
jgi:hypothetical protein